MKLEAARYPGAPPLVLRDRSSGWRVVPPRGFQRPGWRPVMQDDKKQHEQATQQQGGEKDKKLSENSKENLDDKLDHGVEESFPASDPVSVKITK
jgi:hypothetical protein